ncbi:hypothetical protein J6590_062293 [Homalodisca vitripennis]|nr:hypothetical protein J6590_062293 [Homalodisca vitripennis]
MSNETIRNEKIWETNRTEEISAVPLQGKHSPESPMGVVVDGGSYNHTTTTTTITNPV